MDYMLKFLQNRDEAIDLVHSLSECPELSDFKLGLAGSFVQGLNKKASPIDIVLKLKEDKNSDMIGSFYINGFIRKYLSDLYSNKVHIIWLDLLETDEESLLEYMPKVGVEMNPESAYTNIASTVKWVNDEEDDSESDRIANVVTTWDEDEDSNAEEDDE
jgi:hypothetical protein